LHHPVLAGAASVFRSPHDRHLELGGDDVELLADVFADPMERAFAARAMLVLNADDCLEARQMRRQRAAIGAFRRAFGMSPKAAAQE
jgi:hypothetical protein